jgi:hypothetical protein
MIKNPLLCKALERLVDEWAPIEGRTRLMKLIYLADLDWAKRHAGRPYTEAVYYRWNHGPFSREVVTALEWMDGIEIVQSTLSCDGGETFCYRSGGRTRLSAVELDPGFVDNLDRLGKQWASRPLEELLSRVYYRDNFLKRAFGEPLINSA